MSQEIKKNFDNTSSSYLSLKAELLRKQQDVQRASSASVSSTTMLENLQSTSSSLKIKVNPDIDIEVSNSSKKKKKQEENTSVPTTSLPAASSALSREDEMAYAKSRTILEAKSKLYDEIMSNSEMRVLAEDDDDDDNDKSFLVDFERKIYETNQTKPQTDHNKIEYTDSFGRTRLVTPEEYEQLKASEKKVPQDRAQSYTTEQEIDRVERLHREQMRSKWEKQMEELRNKSNLHYQDVLFDEKREHGVGYYNFSTDDKERAEQMATLNELRTNTKIQQSKSLQEKEQRLSSTADRLNKIRLRKAKELGIDLFGNKAPTPAPIEKSEPQREIEILAKEVPTEVEPIHEAPVTVEISSEQQIQVNHPELIQSAQSTEQAPQKIAPVQQKSTPLPQKTNPAFMYPFPVMRSNTLPSSSMSNRDS